jgi:hypothetical protein
LIQDQLSIGVLDERDAPNMVAWQLFHLAAVADMTTKSGIKAPFDDLVSQFSTLVRAVENLRRKNFF